MSRSGLALCCSQYSMPFRPSSSCTVPMKMMSPLLVNLVAFITRSVASMFATEAVLSPTPGANSVSPERRTLVFVSGGNTMSVCAAITIVGPPPVPLRTPVTLPMESTDTASPSCSNTFFTYAPRCCSSRDFPGISAMRIHSSTCCGNCCSRRASPDVTSARLSSAGFQLVGNVCAASDDATVSENDSDSAAQTAAKRTGRRMMDEVGVTETAAGRCAFSWPVRRRTPDRRAWVHRMPTR